MDAPFLPTRAGAAAPGRGREDLALAAPQTDDNLADAPGAPPAPDAPADGAVDVVAETAPTPRGWGDVWQIPSLILSFALIGFGLWFAAGGGSSREQPLGLDEVDRLIAEQEFDAAETKLRDEIEPRLPELTVAEKARFFATIADWIFESQEAMGVNQDANHREVDKLYSQAVELGLHLSVPRLERWGESLVALGELDRAERCVRDLEALGVTEESGDVARAARNRLLRHLVEADLHREEHAGHDVALAALERFRTDPLVGASDRAWALAKQADLRLSAGEAELAERNLLVGMRRLEGEPDIQPEDLGGLYVLLARAALEMNDQESSTYYAEEAMRLLPDADERESEARLVLADIHLARQEFEEARQLYGEIIKAVPGADAAVRAQFGRAVVRGVLGLYPDDIADFSAVIEANGSSDRLGPAVPRDDIAAALADRHDAALTSLQLDRALEYIRLAEGMYESHDAPAEILYRLASTSRQAAVDLLEHEDADWRIGVRGEPSIGLEAAKVDPEMRRQAAELFDEAGDAFIRHAREMAGQLGADDAWAQSLWLAADSFDLGGDRARAVEIFSEYLAGRPVDDPRRAEVMYRLAQALRAEGETSRAAEQLEELIDAYPRSTWGTRSHVPLARCYVALDRRPEAVAQLQRVLDGVYPVTPDAVDYRLSMLELGRLRHESGEFRMAVELLDATIRLADPDARWRPEAAYRLADSYRQLARQIETKLEESPDIRLPDDRATMKADRLGYLARARDLFAIAAHEFGQRSPATMDESDRTMERLAWLYGGDCSFELGEYAAAVQTYDQAARRFAEHHSSMHALVQIVNCYLRMGDSARAELAHEHAVYRLRELPDKVFSAPDAVMDRQAWERWLKQRPVETAMPSDTPAAETRMP